MTVRAGIAAITHVYHHILRVDAEWSAWTPQGFRWWAYRQPQTIEVIGTAPDDERVDVVSVRTAVLEGVELTDDRLPILNELAAMASMSGLVYDADAKTLDLAALTTVHEGNRPWMETMLGLVAGLQLDEAHRMAEPLAQMLGSRVAESGPPRRGLRPEMDDIGRVVPAAIQPFGQEPNQWTQSELDETFQACMQQPPVVLSSDGEGGVTVEFPFGRPTDDRPTSLLQLTINQPHPHYGNGLFMLQRFPVPCASEAEGLRLALAMNRHELCQRPLGYGFGSYLLDDGSLAFVAFIPHIVYRPGMLATLFMACSKRAKLISHLFTGVTWETWDAQAFATAQQARLRAMQAFVATLEKRSPRQKQRQTKTAQAADGGRDALQQRSGREPNKGKRRRRSDAEPGTA